jgi:hypothetical protein
MVVKHTFGRTGADMFGLRKQILEGVFLFSVDQVKWRNGEKVGESRQSMDEQRFLNPNSRNHTLNTSLFYTSPGHRISHVFVIILRSLSTSQHHHSEAVHESSTLDPNFSNTVSESVPLRIV